MLFAKLLAPLFLAVGTSGEYDMKRGVQMFVCFLAASRIRLWTMNELTETLAALIEGTVVAGFFAEERLMLYLAPT